MRTSALFLALSVEVLATAHNESGPVVGIERRAHENATTLSLPLQSTNGKDITPDPFAYAGIYGVYTLSTYRSPLLRPSYVATFLMTCLGDLSDATSEQSYKPSDPYPDSLYVCNLRYTFPNFDIMTFHLELKKIAAAGWEMTFSDLAHDLEELWYALMWFDDKPGMVPNLEIGVQKYTKGVPGPKFQAAAGSLTFREGRIEGNVSVS